MRGTHAGINWNRLTAFYYAARFGNIKHACAKLNVDQSTLSRTIQSLEDSLNFKLFNRVPQGIVLTKQGEIIFKTVENILHEMDAALLMANEEGKMPKGVLKVATTVALASLWLVEMITDFLEAYPDIELYVIGADERLNIQAREADVLIAPYIEHSSDLIQTYLFSCRLQLYASPEYLEKYGTPQSVNDLDHHRLIAFGKDSVPFTFETNTVQQYTDIDWFLRIGLPSGKVRKPYLSINSSKGASILAERGLGIVALSDEFPHLSELNLLKVLPDVYGPTIDLYYTYPQSLKNSQRVKVFGEYLAARIPRESKRDPVTLSTKAS